MTPWVCTSTVAGEGINGGGSAARGDQGSERRRGLCGLEGLMHRVWRLWGGLPGRVSDGTRVNHRRA
jgi:hypothetical protein